MGQLSLQLLLIVMLASTAFSAELGAGKTLKADKGPTLEQTTDFIKSKFKEFHSESRVYYLDGDKIDEDYKWLDIYFNKCDVVIQQVSSAKYGNYHTIYKFNLSDISKVMTTIDDKYTSGSGVPLYDVEFVSNDELIIVDLRFYKEKSPNEIKYKKTSIPMKNKEFATRLANAFERAVQLCGGGKDIGKEDIF